MLFMWNIYVNKLCNLNLINNNKIFHKLSLNIFLGWVHSGDIGYFDEDGELFIIDRIKELIKYRGYQISPGEIEGVLLSHPAVLEVAVIGVPHAIDDEHPLAYVTKIPGAKVQSCCNYNEITEQDSMK